MNRTDFHLLLEPTRVHSPNQLTYCRTLRSLKVNFISITGMWRHAENNWGYSTFKKMQIIKLKAFSLTLKGCHIHNLNSLSFDTLTKNLAMNIWNKMCIRHPRSSLNLHPHKTKANKHRFSDNAERVIINHLMKRDTYKYVCRPSWVSLQIIKWLTTV